jgi:HSP20 family protein
MASHLARRPALDLRREIDQLFESFLSPGQGSTPPSSDDLRIAVEMSETDDAYKLTAEVPGQAPDQIEVQVDQGVLTIRGEKRRTITENLGGVNYTELDYGTFARSVQLPPGVDTSRIEAKVENGVLTITVPKAEAARPRRIPLAGQTQGAKAQAPQMQAGQTQAGQQTPAGQPQGQARSDKPQGQQVQAGGGDGGNGNKKEQQPAAPPRSPGR